MLSKEEIRKATDQKLRQLTSRAAAITKVGSENFEASIKIRQWAREEAERRRLSSGKSAS